MTRARSEASDMDDLPPEYNGEEPEDDDPFDGFAGAVEPYIVPREDWPKDTAQLQAFVMRAGRATELGMISPTTTLSEFLLEYQAIAPAGGTFHFMPVNAAGRRLKSEPWVRDVSAGHPVYQAAVASDSPRAVRVAGSASADAGLVPLVLKLQEKRADREQETLRVERERLAQREERLERERAQLEDKRLALAVEASAITERSSKEFANRSAAMGGDMIKLVMDFTGAQQVQSGNMFAQVLALQQQAATSQINLITANAEAADRRAKLDADERERREESRRAREEREEETRRRRLEEEHIRTMERVRAEAAADLERLRATTAAATRGSGVKGLLAEFAPVLAFVESKGLDIKDIFGFFTGGGPKTMLEVGGSIVEKVVDGVIRAKELELQAGPAEEEEDDDPVVTVKFADGTTRRMKTSEAHALQAQHAQAQQAAQQQQPQGFIAPRGPQPHQSTAQAPQPQTQAPTNQAAALDARTQKAGRTKARELKAIVERHMSKPDDNAFGMAVLTDIQAGETSAEFETFVRAVGFTSTLRETGLADAAINRLAGLLEALQQAGNFPTDIPIRK